ncbi:MAG: hypothetical protein GY756_24955 [bacterium]|nr:hypothetical protein [bacterium]
MDKWINEYNNERRHQGKMCYVRPPMQIILDSKLYG